MKRILFLARTAAAAVLCLSGLAAQSAPAAAPVELPVSRVVLYSSGVGFFQHSGTVEGDSTVRFSFKTEQINDLLKSMVLRDAGGGSIGTVTYASQDPVARALRSFAVDLSDKPGMAALLDRLRGAAVTVMAPQAISGTILGIERQPRAVAAGGQTIATEETWLNLLCADGLKSLPASSVSAIKLQDPRLNDELNRALALIIQSADTQRRAVDVQFLGKGRRAVAVDYIAEAPVWKTSYRLDLSSGGFLQGWAIVENTSDADWSGITLALASGSPVSFIQDLYTPLYVSRPTVAPSVQAQVAPRSYDEGMAGPQAEEADRAMPLSRSAPAPAMAPSPKRAELASGLALDRDGYGGVPGEPAQLDLRKSAALSGAQGQKLGELFNFTIRTPVSLARRQSAMLPILNQDIGVEKVSIYNQSVLPRNPMTGAFIKNTSGLRLPPGAITVFDGGMYAGDALLDTFGDQDQRLISYAVDLDTLVDPGQYSTSQVTKVSIIRGVLNIQRSYTYTQAWRIQNKAARDKTIVIEYPRNGARSLVTPKDPLEQTDSLYRFKTVAAKSATSEFKVVEQQGGTETIALLGTRAPGILYYLNYDKVGPTLKAALQKAADLRQKWDAAIDDAKAAAGQKADIENGQGRLRSNIETVGRDTPQGQRYLQKLLEGEDQIDKLAERIDNLQDLAKKAQAELENYLKNLQVE